MLPDWEQDALSQLKEKAESIPEGKVYKLGISFKIDTSSGIHHMLSFAYSARAPDIEKAFGTLIEAFGGSKIIDFDVWGVDEIPPAPSPLLKNIEDAQKKVDKLANDVLNEVIQTLPSDVRSKKGRFALEGYFVYVKVRTVGGAITYDFSSAGGPLTAASLASFLYRKASEINISSVNASITREANLKVVDMVPEKGLTTIYVAPL